MKKSCDEVAAPALRSRKLHHGGSKSLVTRPILTEFGWGWDTRGSFLAAGAAAGACGMRMTSRANPGFSSIVDTIAVTKNR